MGMIYPKYLNPDKKFFGEERVFNLFKKIDFPGNFHIFHSLNIPDHISKKEGETDFLILSPFGILVLEIKGAKRIVVKDGIWKYFTETKVYQSHESPFDQAKNNYYSILKKIKKEFPELRNLKRISGYGVIFPTMVFTMKSIEWNDEMVLDENNLDKLEDYVDNLYTYWHKKSQSNLFKLSDETILKLKEYLRPDFEKIGSLKSFISSASEIVEKVTREQFSVLDGLEEYARIMIKGLAGTGKTFLAMEQARRKSSEGKKVLLLCFNKLLMQNLYCQIQNYKNVDIYNIDKLIYDIIKNNNIDTAFISIEQMRLFFSTNAETLITTKYDYLIIDEAQDILSNDLMPVFDELLRGGISAGSWSFFLDDYVQDELFAKKEELNDIIKMLKNVAIVYNLSINCRNSRFLGNKINNYTSLPIPKLFRYEGDQNNLQIIYVNKDSSVDLFANIILKLLEEDITPNSITILAPNKNFELLQKVFPLLKNKIETFIDLTSFSSDIKKEKLYNIRKKCISYSTVQAFKGLENDIIILFNIDSLENIYDRSILYTGMSRAKSKLILLINEILKTKIN